MRGVARQVQLWSGNITSVAIKKNLIFFLTLFQQLMAKAEYTISVLSILSGNHKRKIELL